VVANFSASWCGPCRVISTVYAEMSQTYPQLMFLTVDVDELMVTDVSPTLLSYSSFSYSSGVIFCGLPVMTKIQCSQTDNFLI
jgi:thiol-disulfide isomerase/thioredoxin